MSDLLNEASLVLIPSGIKASKVYAQIPEDGSGDMTFARASTGTRINSQGLVEVVPYNLVEQSQTFDNAYWNKFQCSVTANDTTAPNGTTTADKVIASLNSAAVVYISDAAYISGVYNWSIYAKAGNQDKIYLEAYGVSGISCSTNINLTTQTIISQTNFTNINIENVGNGWYRISATFSNLGGTIVTIGFGMASSVSTNDYAYFWGAQINQGATAKTYLATTDRLNIPRLNYQNGGGGCPSLLLEAQRTNLITYSEQFDNAAWIKYNGATITNNSVTSPDGYQNADTLQVATQTYSGLYQSVSGSSSVYSASIFAKQNTKRWIYIFDASSSASGWFDLQNGVIGTISSGYTGSIENFGNGWFRCTFKKDIAVTPAFFQIGVSDADGYSTPSSTGSIYIWGAQLEAGSYVSSYIPTIGTSVTRVTDALQLPFSSLLAQSSWTILFDHKIVGGDGGSAPMYSLYETGADNVFLFVNGNAGLNLYMPLQGGYVFGTSSNDGFVPNQRSKVLLKYNGTTIKYFINGVLYGSASASLTYTQRALYYETTKSFQESETVFFPTALSDSDCISLTTI